MSDLTLFTSNTGQRYSEAVSLDRALTLLLDLVRARVPLQVWMVSQRMGDHMFVRSARSDTKLPLAPGSYINWTDTLCSIMVEHDGPQFVTDISRIPQYADAPITKVIPIKSYIGVPLLSADGELLGGLCGIDPEARVAGLQAAEGFVRSIAIIAATLLDTHTRLNAQSQLADDAQREATTDPLTGALNRRGLEEMLDRAASQRCYDNVYGGLIMIDLNELKTVKERDGHAAGDALIGRATRTLTTALRTNDAVARLSGDEFVVFVNWRGQQSYDVLARRLVESLERERISAVIGASPWYVGESWSVALARADEAMHIEKQREKIIASYLPGADPHK